METTAQRLRPLVVQAPRRRAVAVGFVLGICALTIAARAGAIGASDIGSSFAFVARGDIWRLVTSAFVADTPVVASLVSFVLIAGVAMVVCRGRLFWLIAMASHVGSAALVYTFIAVSRALVPGAFEPSVDRLDVGVSAMQGGWVGAIACTAWMRTQGSIRGRLLVVLGVAVVAVIGWELHPDPSVLTFEHPVAFAIGIVVAFAGERRNRAAGSVIGPGSARAR